MRSSTVVLGLVAMLLVAWPAARVVQGDQGQDAAGLMPCSALNAGTHASLLVLDTVAAGRMLMTATVRTLGATSNAIDHLFYHHLHHDRCSHSHLNYHKLAWI
ncbi:hypothetical protein ACFX19_021859 [Malus domestica]